MKDLYLIGAVSWWVVALVAAGSCALLVQQFLSLRQRLSLVQSSVLVFLRACVYGLLIFFLLGPTWVEQRTAKLRRPLTVLFDGSQSMAFPADPKESKENKSAKSRLDLVKEKLAVGETPLIQRLARDYELSLYQFGTGLEPIAPSAIPQISPQEQGTRLLEVLQKAAREAGAQAGILVFSDGIANGEQQSPDGAASLPLPVFTVGVGETEGFTDLRIADLRAPEFAFRGRELKLDLRIQAYGLSGQTVPLYFNRGRSLISTRSVKIDRDPFEVQITLAYTPKEIGPHSFSLTLPPQPGEQITQNNHKEFKVEVQRDKVRVLTLSGAPSWNYRFLRMALKQDPLIDLVSFVFLRTPTDSVDVPDNRLSLIPFPIDEIFLEELKNFDVVFLDDFSHRSYFNTLYLEKLRDFVRDGGGLAMFGGVRSFDSGGFSDTPLRDVLPVELDGKAGYQSQGSLRAVLTPSGKAHPVTRLLADPKANEEAWTKMPSLTTLNRVGRARGETLLSVSGDGAGSETPLLTVGRSGKGRTLAMMSDDFWRWNFIAVGDKETPQHHLKLMRQAVRWLAQEPSFEQVQILPIASARPGEKVSFKLRVLKDDFTPARQATLQLRVFGPEGEPFLVQAAAEQEEGDYGAEFTPTREGSYRLEAEAQLSGKPLGKDRAHFTVAFPYGETDDGRPRPELLKRIAEMSQGEFIPIREWNEKSLEKIAAKLERHTPLHIVERRQIQLWSTLWTFSVILVLLSAEWWMRRKWGLI